MYEQVVFTQSPYYRLAETGGHVVASKTPLGTCPPISAPASHSPLWPLAKLGIHELGTPIAACCAAEPRLGGFVGANPCKSQIIPAACGTFFLRTGRRFWFRSAALLSLLGLRVQLAASLIAQRSINAPRISGMLSVICKGATSRICQQQPLRDLVQRADNDRIA